MIRPALAAPRTYGRWIHGQPDRGSRFRGNHVRHHRLRDGDAPATAPSPSRSPRSPCRCRRGAWRHGTLHISGSAAHFRPVTPAHTAPTASPASRSPAPDSGRALGALRDRRSAAPAPGPYWWLHHAATEAGVVATSASPARRWPTSTSSTRSDARAADTSRSAEPQARHAAGAFLHRAPRRIVTGPTPTSGHRAIVLPAHPRLGRAPVRRSSPS